MPFGMKGIPAVSLQDSEPIMRLEGLRRVASLIRTTRLEKKLALIDKKFGLSTDINEVFANISLEDFGRLLLDVPDEYPNLKRWFPRMPPDEVQDSWTGSHGEVLLRQTIAFVHSLTYQYEAKLGRAIRDATVLDFGCGWGRILRLLCKFIPADHIYGVDPWKKS